MKLRTRLLAGVSVYQVLLAAVGLIGFLSAQASLRGMEVAVEHHVAELSALGDLASDVNRIHSLALQHALTGSSAEQAAYDAEIRRSEDHASALIDQLLRIQERFNDNADIADITEFRTTWREYLHVVDDEILPLRGPNHQAEFAALTAPDGPLLRPYREATRKLATLQGGLPTEATERLNLARDDFGRNRDLLLVATLLAGVFGIGLGLHQSARLARAVEAVSQAARRVAGGDLSQRVRVETNDEIESLADSFNIMTANLQQMTTAQSAHLSELEAANGALQTEVSERRRAEQALRESETRFRSVTHSVKEAIVSTDRQGSISFWNRGAERIFGYREEEALGMPFDVLLVPEARELGSHNDCLSGVERWVGQTTELVGVSKTRKLVPIELSVTQWAASQELFYTATLRDITERRAVDQLKNEFVSMVSHELRTPMSGVIGMVDLLLGTELSSRQRAYATALEQSGQSLLSLIDDIVDFSKIEAGKFELESGQVDVRDLVESTAGVLAERAARKGIEIAWRVEPDVPGCLGGDPHRVHQVLLNLIANAVKFTDDGEVVVHVRVQDQSSELALVRFEVTDTGIGIPRELRHRLFQPFVQLHDASSRQHGGTGLGLAISKRLVELMGGTVGAEPGPGRGSRFWFSIPFATPADAPDPIATNDGLAGARVLIVDDSPTIRVALEEQLAEWGLRADAVADASAALQQLCTASEAGEAYQVVLLDMQLPSKDGPALARVLGVDPRLGGPRAVAMTPLACAEGDALGELVTAWVEKPVRRARLLEVLAEVVCGPATQPALPPPTEEPHLPPAGARILLIEDTPINQLAAASMLQELGYYADVVDSGRAGLAALERDSYAAVLMDCQMAGLDGFQTTAEIRCREGAGPRTPVIAMTASAMLGDRERCLAAGMDDYLAKPVRLSALAAALGRWVPRAGRSTLEKETLVDLERLASRGQADVVNEMVSLFRKEAPNRLAAVYAALDANDAAALRQAAHKLRGTAAAVGARDVCDLSGEIERWARRGDVGPARLLIEDELPHAIEEACDALDALLETQGGATCAS